MLGRDNQDKINRFLVELEEAKGQLQVSANADLHSLGDDTYGPGVRLEQELIRWDWALERLADGSQCRAS